MAGHSKWANIKHRKAAADARRGKLFTRLLREITVAARLGGGDADANPRLRSGIQEARVNNVPNDNIERAIKKGTGELEGGSLEEIVLEGYGPGGVAVLVEAVTDNRNRTVSEIRHLFSRHDGNLGESGCVAWMFDRQGYVALEREIMDEEAFMELALELGVDDIAIEEDRFELYIAVEDYLRVKEELERREVPVAAADLAMIPKSSVAVEGEQAPQVLRLAEALEDHDDVQNVWANFDIDESVLATSAG